jgi:predicted esterase
MATPAPARAPPGREDQPSTHLPIAGTDPIKPPLVLLHRSGGDEHELVRLAADIALGSPILGIRGTVPMDGGFAFFHRFPDRTIDEAAITARVSRLADFIVAASARYSFARAPVAIGFSKRCDHGSGTAPDAPRAADGCDNVPTALSLPG